MIEVSNVCLILQVVVITVNCCDLKYSVISISYVRFFNCFTCLFLNIAFSVYLLF